MTGYLSVCLSTRRRLNHLRAWQAASTHSRRSKLRRTSLSPSSGNDTAYLLLICQTLGLFFYELMLFVPQENFVSYKSRRQGSVHFSVASRTSWRLRSWETNGQGACVEVLVTKLEPRLSNSVSWLSRHDSCLTVKITNSLFIYFRCFSALKEALRNTQFIMFLIES